MKKDTIKRSTRQKKLDKHANTNRNKRKLRVVALAVTAMILAIPFYFKYLHA